MKVEVLSVPIDKQWGYDIRVIDETASVADYLEALNLFILRAKITRSRSQIEQCEGCPQCCAERIPLTSVDFFQSGEDDVISFVKKHCYVTVEGHVVDIMIAASGDGKCHWLDKKTGKCSIYGKRSFVCQTYICCPSTERAKTLRSNIVNIGEDELVRLWLNEGFNRQVPLEFDEIYDLDIDLKDWQKNAFSDKKRYEDILIKDLLSDEEWQILVRDCEDE